MVSRLFGRSKKPATPQEPQPSVTPVETEDEGFTILGGTSQSQSFKSAPNIYPSLQAYPPVSPSGVPQAQANGYNDITSVTASHYLDGVPFVLSSQCSLGNEQFDSIVAKIDSFSERVKSIRWNDVGYDFNVERSVVHDVAITDTLKRLHAS